jgi:hypothetical protein
MNGSLEYLGPGSLIRVKKCSELQQQVFDFETGCGCAFCKYESSRVGIVIEHREIYTWAVMFDFGEYLISDVDFVCGDVEVINVSR